MANQRLAKVIVTANATTAKKVMEEFDQLIVKYTNHVQELTAAGKANTAECKQSESVLKALSQYQRDNIEDTKRLGEVVQDLTNTKLRDLRRAMGSGKSALAKLTGSDADLKRAEQIRGEMKQVGDQMRLIEGQYVKIADGLKNVSNQSDQWLDKAIKQQRDLVGSLQKSDASYQQNLATLKQLEAEEDRRKGKMGIVEARQTVTSQNASASDLRRAKSTLTEARDNTPTGNTGDIAQYNKELQEIEKRLEAVSGKAQKASMSWKQMKQVLAEPNRASGEDIKRTMEVIQQKIQQLPAGSKYVADLRRQYSMLEQTLKGTRMSQSALNDILTRSKQGKASLDELRRAYKQLEEELNQINTKSKEFADKQKSMKELKKNIDEATGAVNKQGGAWRTALKNLTAYVGLFAVFNQIKSLLTSVIKKNFEYSGSLTDIRKIAGLANEDINELSRSLAKIETRTSTEGLAKIAYEGAKLGMSKYGIEGMSGFVRAADQINVAIGEEMGEQALPALSKMVEVMGLIPKMGIEKSLLSTGSAMFKLATSSTATSNDITEFAKRCTGVARTAGITTDQLLALGSAFSSQMASPEVAATAMSKFIVALQKNHNLIEKDLDIPDGTINKMYSAGQAMDAIVLILEKMKAKGNMNALGEIFKDVGGDGQRLISSMVTMAKNVDMLKDHLDVSSEAFREGTAVTAEYEMQQESAIGILERANNLWEKAFINPDGVDNVKSLAQAWYDVSKFLTENKVAMFAFNAILQVIIWSCQTLAYILPGLLAGLLFKGASAAIQAIGRAFVGVSETAIIATLRTEGLNAAWKKLNASMKANWISLIIGLLVELGVTLYSVFKKTNDLADAQLDVNKYVEEGAAKWEQERRKIDSYVAAISSANTNAKERARLIKNFNKDYKPYLEKLGLEVNSVDTLKRAYSRLNEELKKKMFYEIRQKAFDTELGKVQGKVGKATLAYSKYINSEKGSTWYAYDTKYLQDEVNRGRNAQQIYRAMVEGVYGKSGKWSGYNGDYVLGTGSVNDKALLAYISNFVNAQKEYDVTKNTIKKALDPLVGDYDPFAGEDVGTLGNSAEDKDAKRLRLQAERDQKRSWREELKQKQDQAKAIMDDVDNYYDRQINAKLAQAISLNMDETEQKQFVLSLKQNKETARSQVRLAVAGQPNKWEDAKKMMVADKVEQADETGIDLSKDLLDGILNNNIEGLRKLMADLGKKLGMSMNSITAQIFAKATRSEQEILKMQLKQQEARRKIAMEHDYTGIVQQNSYDNFNEMGYAAPTKEETTVTKKMVDGKEVLDTSAFDKRRKAIKDMYETARKSLAQLYTIDVSTTDGKGMLMKMLFGDDPDGMAARIKESLGENEESWKAFYLNLIQYSDEYAAAEKKKYDEAKKITDFWWSSNKRNLAQQERIRKMQQESNLFGKRTNLLSNLGLANLTADPEIELMKARMQAAEDYYAFVERNTKNKQLIDEAERARQEAELVYANQMATAMKSRLSQMKELVQPIETFGAEVGKAFAQMKSDVSSAQESIKNALKSMIESWANMALNDVNTQMWKAINDAGAKQGKNNAQPGIDAARANAKANATTIDVDWRNLGTADNPMWVRIVGGQYIDANGNNLANTEPPAAWKKRHPNGTIHDYNKETYGIDTASQAGTAAAGAITGGTTLSDAVAGIGGSLVGDLMNTKFTLGGSSKKTGDDKEKAKQLKKEKKHQKELSKEVKKGAKDREKETHQGVKNITDITDAGNKEQSKSTEIAQNAILDMTQTAMTTNLANKEQNNQQVANSDAARTNQEVTFSIAGAMAKCFEFLGPIAGPIAAAGVMATLMGLLQWALNSAFSSSSKKSSSVSKNTKLVSGMLTYDSGNVQDLKPFVADNGEIYWATEDDGKQKTGVQMIRTPTATTINGQPSLVAENGPELVIGRETTQAMMMNNPALLKALVNYDSNYSGRRAARRAFDNGNVGELASAMGDAAAGFTAENGNLLLGAPSANNVIANNTASQAALMQAVKTLLDRLDKPIYAKIDMYGRGNLYDSMTKANQFMKGKG